MMVDPIPTVPYLLVDMLGLLGALCILRWIGTVSHFAAHAWVFSIAWASNLVAAQLALGGSLRPDILTVVIALLAWWLFLIGSALPLRHNSGDGSRTNADRVRTEETALYGRAVVARCILALLLLLQGVAIYLELTYAGISAIPTSVSDMASLRLAGIIGAGAEPSGLGSFRWCYVLYVPLAIGLYRQRRLSRFVFFLVLCFAIVSGGLRFTRAPLLQLTVIALSSWAMIYGPPFRKAIMLVGAAVVAFGLVFMLSQGVLIDVDPMASLEAGESLWGYLGASLKAYEAVLNNTNAFPPGWYSFDVVYLPLSKLSLVTSYPSLVRPEIHVGLATNLYTFLDALTADFGVAGALAGALVTGLLSSWVFVKALAERRFWAVVTYSYVVYACLMSPANNEFLRFSFAMYLFLAWIIDRAIDAGGCSLREPDARRLRRLGVVA